MKTSKNPSERGDAQSGSFAINRRGILMAAIASAGFGLGMAVFYWIIVALHAYAIKDRVMPSQKDEGEQY